MGAIKEFYLKRNGEKNQKKNQKKIKRQVFLKHWRPKLKEIVEDTNSKFNKIYNKRIWLFLSIESKWINIYNVNKYKLHNVNI